MRNLTFVYILFTLCFTHAFGAITWNDFMKKAKNRTYTLSEKLKPFISKNYPYYNVSKQCTRSLIRYAEGLKNWEPWAVNMFDVTGKPSSSFFKGTNIDFGSLDNCIEIEVDRNDSSDSFKGQFCMLHMQSPLIAPMSFRADNGTSYIEKYGHPPEWISETMEFDGFLRTFGLYLGICTPSTCSEEDIINIVTAYTKSAEMKVSLTDCQLNEPKKWSFSAKCSLFVILSLIALCTIGTYIDDDIKEDDKMKQMMKAFSITKNWAELTKVDEKKHSLSYLPGLKFWFCLWVTFGHAFCYETHWKERRYKNFFNVLEMMTPITLFVENVTSVVEYYFCISGFLLTYTLWRKLEKNNGNINLKEIIIQKYWRLAPVQFLLILVLFVIPMTLSGPIWNSTWDAELRKCYDYGWSNLFFLQNFHHYNNVCWIHTWYIAAGLQIQIISVLLLVLIYKHPKIGIISGLLISIGCYWRDFYTSSSKGYVIPSLSAFHDFGLVRDYLTDMYLKPYAHFSSNAIGMILGWLVIKGYRIPKKYHIPIWILYFPLTILLIFSIYIPTENITLVALHNTFRNTVQSLLFAWLLYACTTGSAGYIEKLFSFNFYKPLDRISYCNYILHPLIIVFFDANLRERVYMSKVQHTIEGFAVVLLSYIIATIGYLLVEQPANKIYDLWVTKKSTTTQNSEKITQNRIKREENKMEMLQIGLKSETEKKEL